MPRFEHTDNGIPFDWYLSGPDGAGFILYPTSAHSHEDIEAAKKQLRRDRDVTSIRVERTKTKQL